MTALLPPPVTVTADDVVDDRPPSPPHRSLLARLWRGRPGDPAWVRPSLWLLLASTALLYLWNLSASGWANAYYSAAVQAGATDWKAFLFGSFDSANFITVDKPPASLWVMELSARVFGVNSWAILVPQALMGVAAVGVLYLAVRRWHGAAAGLVAGAVLALTPVAALMFRYNNPDALLVLLLTLAAYTTVRATERASTRWLVLTGVLVGFAFLTKMLQGYLTVPAMALTYLVAAPTGLWRRIGQLVLAGVAMVAASGWWIALVELWPASSRPYVGGSQTNSVVELLLGYNGLGRLTGNETGSVVAGGQGGAGAWGETGWDRLFTSSYGGQVAWLVPPALVMLLALVVLSLRTGRENRLRASALLWGGWFLVTAAVISFSQGIIHEYYTVALAPAIGALVAIGGVELWRRRDHLLARVTLAATVVGTAAWAYVLLGRSADFLPWLRVAVVGLGALAAVLLVVGPRAGTRLGAVAATAALLAALAGPAAYAVDTALTAHTGSLPSAGPAVAGSRGGPGGAGGPGAHGGTPPTLPAGTAPTAGGTTAPLGGMTPPAGGLTAGGPTGGGAGGLLDAATPSAELITLLQSDAGSFTWVAATTGANNAAGYQLATGDAVMAIGGFNGSDPYPTLAQFQQLVENGEVHYFIAGGTGGPGGDGTSSAITSWVEANFTATTVGNVTVYDLTT